jgi:hypothetical protein
MKPVLLVSFVCAMTAAWGWLPTPSQGPKQPHGAPEVEAVPQVVTPAPTEAELLARIEALEQRLAQTEQQIAALQNRGGETSVSTTTPKRVVPPKP